MANDIGGDYYRFEPLPDGRLAVVVADASGHGMAAGLLMAIADATLHLAIDIDPSPMAVAGRLHKALRRTEDRRSFLTLFYGLLDPATGELDYVCAGHPFPLVRRASGEIEEPRLGSFPLGLRERLAPATGRLTLAPGDLLVLFSDGLFEGLGPSGDAFGFERLRGAIAAARGAVDAHRRVLDAFARHTAGQPLADDLTLLALERLAGSAPAA
jgi:sigma-B regulation protein RsbU (phosphoserine phosphatase)